MEVTIQRIMKKAFYYLCDMAHKHAQCLEELKEKAFKLLQEGKG